MIGDRIRQLRLARGLSLEALAARMGGILTKQALSKYEQGKAQPSPVMVNKLAAALGVKSVELWAEPSIRVEFIAYRKGAGLLKSEEAKVESSVTESLERRVRLQELTQQPAAKDVPVRSFAVKRLEDAETAAADLRSQWRLGLDAIASLTSVLEDHLIHVLEIEANERFDGISAVAYGSDDEVRAAAVVTRRGVPGERQRLSLAHELAHLVLRVSGSVDEEKAAYRFASAFLAPAEVLFREVGQRRGAMQAAELLLLKKNLGMSVQAIVYRLRELGIINEAHARSWFIHINRLGWKKREPFEMPAEKPQWLGRNVLRAVSEGALSREEGERMLCSKIDIEAPLSLIERRAFLKLPIEQRRQLLAEQASKFVDHYEQVAAQTKGEGEDLVEYTEPSPR